MEGLTLREKAGIIVTEVKDISPFDNVVVTGKGEIIIEFYHDRGGYTIWVEQGGGYNTSSWGWYCSGGTGKARLYGDGYTFLDKEYLQSIGIKDVLNLKDHEYGILKLKYGLTKVDLYLPSFIEHDY